MQTDPPAADPIDLMLAHRSIRRFGPDPVPDEHIDRAVRCGQMASTSSAVQAYALIRVDDPAKRETLAQLAGPQDKVKHCGAFFVCCADTRRHRLICERAGEPYFNSFEAVLVAIADVSFFAQNLSLAFESMGYGICYIGGIRNDLPLVIETLGLPEGVFPLYGLCVGVPAERPAKRPRLDPNSVCFTDSYPDDAELLEGVARYDETYRAYLAERGAEPARWSDAMAARNSREVRADVGGVFLTQGAWLG
ncbi:MAG: NADPH-dependent oxidoreductase [Planctomycetota bacterium]